MSAKVFSAATIGLEALTVEVEADIGRSLPNILVVGLPGTAVQEARERVRSAVKNSSLKFPTTRVTVNLAPGDVRKEGPVYDLPVAIAILLASHEISSILPLDRTMFLGELSLNGSLRPVNGVLSAALYARKAGFTTLIIPASNTGEAALVDGLQILGANSLSEVVRHLIGEHSLSPSKPTSLDDYIEEVFVYDFANIRGQAHAKRALEVAAAGGHNIRMTGPPGSGKTLLARALTAILPSMSKDEILEVTRIYSTAGLLDGKPLVANRPFRSPHHTTSHVALVGGGSTPRPGEVSLAHRGVLFLDEFPEFPRHVLEALRQPLEDGQINVARASGTVTFPARLMLVAAENPCPCGYATDQVHPCTCTPSALLRYQQRVSGPLLDRIDLHVPVPRLEVSDLLSVTKEESSATVRDRVSKARARQLARFKATKVITNSELSSEQVYRVCALGSEATQLLHGAVDKLHLSARAYYRVLKLARTIADLDEAELITTAHVAESLQYRGEDQR